MSRKAQSSSKGVKYALFAAVMFICSCDVDGAFWPLHSEGSKASAGEGMKSTTRILEGRLASCAKERQEAVLREKSLEQELKKANDRVAKADQALADAEVRSKALEQNAREANARASILHPKGINEFGKLDGSSACAPATAKASPRSSTTATGGFLAMKGEIDAIGLMELDSHLTKEQAEAAREATKVKFLGEAAAEHGNQIQIQRKIIFVNPGDHKSGLGNMFYLIAAATMYNDSHEVLIKAHAGSLFPDNQALGLKKDEHRVPYSKSILRKFHFVRELEGEANLTKISPWPINKSHPAFQLDCGLCMDVVYQPSWPRLGRFLDLGELSAADRQRYPGLEMGTCISMRESRDAVGWWVSNDGYENALRVLREHGELGGPYFIISDDQDAWERRGLNKTYPATIISEDDVNQIRIGRFCRNIILHRASTFHLWIAYLRKSNGTVVTFGRNASNPAPGPSLGTVDHHGKDRLLPEWARAEAVFPHKLADSKSPNPEKGRIPNFIRYQIQRDTGGRGHPGLELLDKGVIPRNTRRYNALDIARAGY